MMNVFPYQRPFNDQEQQEDNYGKFSSNSNQEPTSYLNLCHNPSQTSNFPQSLSNDHYSQSIDARHIPQVQPRLKETVPKTAKKIRKGNNKQVDTNNHFFRKQIDPKMFLPKTLQSENKGYEESQSANSCLHTIESMEHQQQYHFIQPLTFQYFAKPNVSGMPLPKLQQDIQPSNSQQQSAQITDPGEVNQKPIKQQSTRKPKKENVNTGHWTEDEHNTYIQFLSQYEDIMTSSSMKKTSKIFKQMSELIGSRTPSQCRSHHQKFNPYALRGENGKRLPRNERSRAGRKRKSQLNDKDGDILNQDYLMDEMQQMEQMDGGFYKNNELMFVPEVCGVQSQQQNLEWHEQQMFQEQQMMQAKGDELQIYQYFEDLKAEELQKKQDDQKMVDMYEMFFKSPKMIGRKGSDVNIGFQIMELNGRQQEQEI